MQLPQFNTDSMFEKHRSIVAFFVLRSNHEYISNFSSLLAKMSHVYPDAEHIDTMETLDQRLRQKQPQFVVFDLPTLRESGLQELQFMRVQHNQTAIVVVGPEITPDDEAELIDRGALEYLNIEKMTMPGLARALRHVVDRQKIIQELEYERNTLSKLVEIIKQGELDSVIEADKKSGLYQIVDTALLEENAKLLAKVQEQNNELKRLAHQDNLTQLANRLQFETTLTRTIAQCRRHDRRLALLFIDLDKFKAVNDSFGHQVGDIILQQASERITLVLRQEDFVARLGGDEFAVILQEFKSVHGTGIVAQKIIDTLAQPYTINGEQISLGCSIGISCFPGDGDNEHVLLKNADIAMYCAKKSGRNQFQYSTPELHDQHMRRLTVENALSHAIENNELSLVFQPIISLVTDTMVGMEVLTRWNSKELGFVPPDYFFDVAEETGMIFPIGRWVLRKTCEQMVHWKALGLNHSLVAINLSPLQLEQKGFFENVLELFEEHGIAIDEVEFEVTEKAVMAGTDDSVDILLKLAQLGGHSSVDDFGTGYSSLERLKKLPISTLKIDRSFVSGIGDNKEDEVIVKTIISLANQLGLDTVAEGIETPEQRQFLIDHGCTRAQGYYFSKPLILEDMTGFLKKQ